MPRGDAARRSDNGYRLTKQQGKPIFPEGAKAPMNRGFLNFPGRVDNPAVYAAFIPMLKLSFKFDRS